MSRSCTVHQHTRTLRDRLDTPAHRQLAAEIAQVRNSDFIGEVLATALEAAFADLVSDASHGDMRGAG